MGPSVVLRFAAMDRLRCRRSDDCHLAINAPLIGQVAHVFRKQNRCRSDSFHLRATGRTRPPAAKIPFERGPTKLSLSIHTT